MALQEEIKSKKCYPPFGPLSLGIKAGDFICLSATLPLDCKTGKVESDDFRTQAEMCLRNLDALLKASGLTSAYVLKTTVYITDMNNYDILNEVYAEHFKKPYPARAVIGVQSLPKNAQISIEAYAVDTRALEVIIASEESCCSGKSCGVQNDQ